MGTGVMTFQEIQFASDEFQQECELRQAVLRAPLGLNLYDEDLDAERGQWHFGLFDPSAGLVACVIAVPLASTSAKIRQMAVHPAQQGRGHGRTILQHLEAHLARRGSVHLNMHARLTAVGFYEKLGYARSGPEFIEVGIPHVRMEKHLSA